MDICGQKLSLTDTLSRSCIILLTYVRIRQGSIHAGASKSASPKMEGGLLNRNFGYECAVGKHKSYLAWIRQKHRQQRGDFVNKLVKLCAAEFSSRSHLTDDQRAEIYNRIRERLQRDYDNRLRTLARIHCSS